MPYRAITPQIAQLSATTPVTTSADPSRRNRPSDSRIKNVPIRTAKMDEVSRNAATGAIAPSDNA